jgi:hypothetical protein
VLDSRGTKPPTQISRNELLVCNAVDWGRIFAVQQVDGPPTIDPRRGPKGSVTDRWPHTIAVKKLAYISPVTNAPSLRDVHPKFANLYGGRNLRQKSHFEIDDADLDVMAAAIEAG